MGNLIPQQINLWMGAARSGTFLCHLTSLCHLTFLCLSVSSDLSVSPETSMSPDLCMPPDVSSVATNAATLAGPVPVHGWPMMRRTAACC